ncbi:MAG: pseudouridine synthase [bacterium]|nr:pseudouridine synthase [bacterium]
MYPIRINKYLRDKGLASRREADKLVAEGRVYINKKAAPMGAMVKEKDRVTISKNVVRKHVYLAYYKPRGLATQAIGDEESVINQWQNKGLFPVGRLDKESEGLLILTNDGRLTTKITGQDSKIEKEYIVKITDRLKKSVAEIFKKGMTTKAFGQLLPAKARVINRSTLSVVLREGKRHQIRVMLAELGYEIANLKRVRIGKISLGDLNPGESRTIAEDDILHI